MKKISILSILSIAAGLMFEVGAASTHNVYECIKLPFGYSVEFRDKGGELRWDSADGECQGPRKNLPPEDFKLGSQRGGELICFVDTDHYLHIGMVWKVDYQTGITIYKTKLPDYEKLYKEKRFTEMIGEKWDKYFTVWFRDPSKNSARIEKTEKNEGSLKILTYRYVSHDYPGDSRDVLTIRYTKEDNGLWNIDSDKKKKELDKKKNAQDEQNRSKQYFDDTW